MIVVVASSISRAAHVTVRRWGTDRAAILTCEDLSVPGWRYGTHDGPEIAVIGGQAVPLDDISGVITCLPAVSELELLHIASGDRAYVAAEMTAFLLAWLTELQCPVINRPSPVCLTGPFWRREQWVSVAHGVGLPVLPVCRRVSLAQSAEPCPAAGVEVTAIGGRTIGYAYPDVLSRVRALAEAAGVDVLTVRLTDPGPSGAFISADPTPDLTSEDKADRILECVEGRSINRPEHPNGVYRRIAAGRSTGSESR